MVDDVGLIPEDLEIRGGGLHLGKALDGLITVSVAIGVGVLRHAPDTLDGIVLSHQLFHNVHIGAVGGHGHADELKAELLGDSKVTVIAGHRAEELALLHLRPRTGRLREAEHITDVDEVVHQLQAGVAAHEYLVGLYAEHICKQGACLAQTLQLAVVAGVGACIRGVVGHLQQVHCQIHLVGAGLAACHVQLQTLCLKLFISLFQRCLFSGQRIAIHLVIICH